LLNRRKFLASAGLGVLITPPDGSCSAADNVKHTSDAATLPKMKLGCQSGPTTDEHFAFFARYGVRNCSASPIIADPSRLYPTVDELKSLVDMAGRHGVSVDMVDSVLLQSTHIDRERNPAIMLGQSPQRDRDIEAFQILIKNCAAAGIPAVKYNMSLLGVLRTGHVPGRGDAQYTAWRLADATPHPPLTRAGIVNGEVFWERIGYFLDHVVPVAAEYKVRLACHPQDPGVPASGYQGVDRVLGTIDGLKRFVSMRENPYHGLNFCQGTIAEDLEDPKTEIFDVIRYFGQRKKIFNVHFRNIHGRRDDFMETFPEDGDIDFVKAVQVYREVGYEGMLMPDHVPLVPVKSTRNDYAYNYGSGFAQDDGHLESFAFAYGYIRGLLQSALLL
jgi:mannonate dehydratase